MVSNAVLLKGVVGLQLFRQVGSRSGVIVLDADPGLTSLTRKYLYFFLEILFLEKISKCFTDFKQSYNVQFKFAHFLVGVV
jgi:hypothetical protein